MKLQVAKLIFQVKSGKTGNIEVFGSLIKTTSDSWKNNKEIMRIKEDLDMIGKEISLDIKNETFQIRSSGIDMFYRFRDDLQLKVPAKVFRKIQDMYQSIKALRDGVNLPDINNKNHENVVILINDVLSLLERTLKSN